MQLTQEQIDRFRRDGVLVAPNVVTEADLQPVIDELSELIDRKARKLQAEGKLTDLHEDKPFATRFTYLHRQCKEMAGGMDIMAYLGKAMFGYLINKNLLDAVESLIGPEISCSPIQHLRPKLPSNSGGSTKNLTGDVPWHQDAGVADKDADVSDMVTFWMPLVNATRETGCMQVLPGVFKNGYLDHVASDYGTMVDPKVLPNVEPMLCECPKGGAVIMNNMTPHMGLPNVTQDTVRWTIDLRYQRIGTPSARPFLPDFVARSRSNPSSELRSHAEWTRLWTAALENVAKNPPVKSSRIKK